jgi:ABC-type branched-subunit amino acid transport system ATPase component
VSEARLRVENLTVSYRGIVAVDKVSLEVDAGSCVAIIGANGAGKTSVLWGISGLKGSGRGSAIWLDGERIEGLPAERRVRRGLGHVLEGRHIFPNLTVQENLEMGLVAGRVKGKEAKDRMAEVEEIFPELKSITGVRGGGLSGGQQQFLAVARALISNPSVLLLDEPTVGLAPMVKGRIGAIIQQLVARGVSVLLVEQSLEIVRMVAPVVHVLIHGRIDSTLRSDDQDLEALAHHAYLR